MSNKNNLIKDILAVVKKYNIKLFSIIASSDGNIGIIDTIQDHRAYEDILMQLFEEFHAITFPENSSESLKDNPKNIPVEFLTGCMKATMNHLSNLQSDSKMDKYNQFSKGIIEGLSDEEVNEFIDIKMKEGTIPIQYFDFNELEECKGKGNVHLTCHCLPILCDLCEYLQLSNFHIMSMPNGIKDLTVPSSVSINKVKEFLRSDIHYNVFKLDMMDVEIMKKICKDHPYPGNNER